MQGEAGAGKSLVLAGNLSQNPKGYSLFFSHLADCKHTALAEAPHSP